MWIDLKSLPDGAIDLPARALYTIPVLVGMNKAGRHTSEKELGFEGVIRGESMSQEITGSFVNHCLGFVEASFTILIK